MHITDIFKRDKTTFSFEFFPPKDAAASELLFHTIKDIMPLGPSYVSVTYGAGAPRERSRTTLCCAYKRKPVLL